MENESLYITVEVTVNKPVSEVWRRWSTPKDIMQWNIPFEDWHSPRVENDLKSGGHFSFRMESKDGSEGFDHSGIYDCIVDQNLIEYTGNDGRKSVIKFISNEDNTTTVTESFEPEKTISIEMQKNFCQSVLTNFKRYVEAAQ